jgi:Ca2+-binding RTX toxin-like protein
MFTYTGTSGNDQWSLSPGTFTIDGLDGIDTVSLGQSHRDSFTITKTADGAIHVDTISGSSDQLHLTLYNVERLVFFNRTDTLDLTTYFGDAIAPTISSFNPGLNANNVIPNKDIVLTFNEAIAKGTGDITITKADGSLIASYNVIASPNVTVVGNALSIKPSSDLSFGTGYNVNIANGAVKDLAGNAFIGNSAYSFVTVARGNVVGTFAADTLTGTSNNDLINGQGGNDTIFGGAGTDTAIYSGKRIEYTLSGNLSNLNVKDNSPTARDGTDTLSQVERLEFSDGAVAFDIAKGQNAGDVYRIYQAAFDRKPDGGGLGFWINALDHGTSLTTVAAGFVGSAEFKALYGTNPSNSTLVTNFYANVLHRAPDQGGFNFWLGLLNNGTINAADALKSFSESDENIAQVLGAIQNGIDYTVYLG